MRTISRNNLKFWKVTFGIPIWVQLPRTLFVMLKEVALPLRRASSVAQAFDRGKCLVAGVLDSIPFALGRPVRFEKRLFRD